MSEQIKTNEGIFQSGGNISAGNLAVGRGARIQTSDGQPLSKEEVIGLLDKFRSEITSLPESASQEKNALDSFANALQAEAKKEQPNPSFWKVTASGLIDAAQSVAALAPTVLTTATQIAGWLSPKG